MCIKKIKIFTSYNEHESKTLENEVNEFLTKEIELGLAIIDIKYQMAPDYDSYSCLVYYTEPVKEK